MDGSVKYLHDCENDISLVPYARKCYWRDHDYHEIECPVGTR